MTLTSAVDAQGTDAGVPAHYGNPFAEQRFMAEHVGFVNRGNRGVIAIGGADRWSWLHSLTTQHLEKLGEWRGAEALILTPHGHVEHDLLLADDGETTWLDVEPETAPELASYLERMRFMLAVEPADVSADWAVLSVLGPQADDALAVLGAQLDTETWSVAPVSTGGWVRRNPRIGPDGITHLDLLVPRNQLAQRQSELVGIGAAPAGIEAFEALRVAGRRPRLKFDTDHRTLVQEVDWVPTAVHLKKGCYRGQETVAKVQNLGQRPRRLVLLHFDGASDELPKHNAPIMLGEKQVGILGTVVRHYEQGTIALALVKRTIADDAELFVGSARVAIDAG